MIEIQTFVMGPRTWFLIHIVLAEWTMVKRCSQRKAVERRVPIFLGIFTIHVRDATDYWKVSCILHFRRQMPTAVLSQSPAPISKRLKDNDKNNRQHDNRRHFIYQPEVFRRVGRLILFKLPADLSQVTMKTSENQHQDQFGPDPKI